MVIYNAEGVIIIYGQCVCVNHIPWSYRDVMMYDLHLRMCLLKYKACSTVLYMIFNVAIYVSPVY